MKYTLKPHVIFRVWFISRLRDIKEALPKSSLYL